MEEQKFSNGSIVQLKSGGPKMTIDKYGTFMCSTGYLCVWFDDKNEPRSQVFAEQLLELLNQE